LIFFILTSDIIDNYKSYNCEYKPTWS
jgi:hypothetical protein